MIAGPRYLLLSRPSILRGIFHPYWVAFSPSNDTCVMLWLWSCSYLEVGGGGLVPGGGHIVHQLLQRLGLLERRHVELNIHTHR